MKTPLISVPIPVYNVEPYLNSCLESVVGQTYHNLDIVLLLQPCTDGTESIAREWLKKDMRIRIVELPFADLANARNAGVENSLGELVCFVDSDDMLHPRHIENMLQTMETTGVDIVQAKVYAFHNQDKLPDYIPGTQKIDIVSARDFELGRQKGIYGSWATVVQTKLYKKSVFEGVVFPTNRVCEDVAATFKTYYNAKNIAIVDSESYFYRSNREGSITHDASKVERIVEHGYLARKDMFDFFEEKDKEIASYCAYYLCNEIVRAKNLLSKDVIKQNNNLQKMIKEYPKYIGACDKSAIGIKRYLLAYLGRISPRLWYTLNEKRKTRARAIEWKDKD